MTQWTPEQVLAAWQASKQGRRSLEAGDKRRPGRRTLLATIGVDVRVLAEFPTPGGGGKRGGRLLLLDLGPKDRPVGCAIRGDREGGPYGVCAGGRYVAAWQGEGDPYWSGGRHFDDLGDAHNDFRTRVERGY